MKDAILAIDQRIEKKAPYPFEEGIIQSAEGNNVRVQLLGSSSVVVAYCDPSIKPEVGKSCVVIWLPYRKRYVVTSLYTYRISSEIASNTPLEAQELFPPADIVVVHFPYFMLIQWAAVVKPTVLFEMQLTATDDDPGNYYTYLTTTGSMAILEYPDYDALVRIRAITVNGKPSGWSSDIPIPASCPYPQELNVEEPDGSGQIADVTTLRLPEGSVFSDGSNIARFRQNSSVAFTQGGALAVSDGVFRAYNLVQGLRVITKVHLYADTAPTGQAIKVDIHKNGTTIFTDQDNRPEIAAAANEGDTVTIDDNEWEEGDYLTAHIDQVGSGTAGADLTITVVFYT
jgi:hypothetical protein